MLTSRNLRQLVRNSIKARRDECSFLSQGVRTMRSLVRSRSLHEGVLGPEVHRSGIFPGIQRIAISAFCDAQGIPQECCGVLRTFRADRFAEDSDHPIIRIDLDLLLDELLAGVHHHVEVGRLRRLHTLKPAGQHLQLLGPSCFVPTLQMPAVLVRDLHNALVGVCVVLNKQVLNKRRVTVLQLRAFRHRRIDQSLKLLWRMTRDLCATIVRVEMTASKISKCNHSELLCVGFDTQAKVLMYRRNTRSNLFCS